MTLLEEVAIAPESGVALPPAEDDGARRDGRVVRAERIRAERRRQVLDCAKRIFADKGYHATSIDDIISGASIARGTFYLYFHNKRALFEELIDGFLVLLTQAIHPIQVAASARPPIEQMQDNVMRLLALLEDHREMTGILIRQAEGLDVDFDRKLSDFYGAIHEMMRGGLQQGITMGLIRPCDPDIVARCILGSIREVVRREVVSSWLLDAKEGKVGVPAREVLAREILHYMMWGTFQSAAGGFDLRPAAE
jgi:AcrR family transcriptional regulator